MGQFQVAVQLTGRSGQTIIADLLVDTGATLVVIPASVAAALDLAPRRTQLVVLAGGREEEWPIADVTIAVEGRETTTPCFIAPDGPALLGAVALESLFLAVDPVAKRLVPVKGYAAVAARSGRGLNHHRWITGVSFHPRRERSSARSAVVAVSSTVHVDGSSTTP